MGHHIQAGELWFGYEIDPIGVCVFAHSIPCWGHCFGKSWHLRTQDLADRWKIILSIIKDAHAWSFNFPLRESC